MNHNGQNQSSTSRFCDTKEMAFKNASLLHLLQNTEKTTPNRRAVNSMYAEMSWDDATWIITSAIMIFTLQSGETVFLFVT